MRTRHEWGRDWLAFQALACFGVAGECAEWVAILEQKINDALNHKRYEYGKSEATANRIAAIHRQQHFERGREMMPIITFHWDAPRRTLRPVFDLSDVRPSLWAWR